MSDFNLPSEERVSGVLGSPAPAVACGRSSISQEGEVFTVAQEARIREIVAEMIGSFAAGANARLRGLVDDQIVIRAPNLATAIYQRIIRARGSLDALSMRPLKSDGCSDISSSLHAGLDNRMVAEGRGASSAPAGSSGQS